MRGVRTVDRGRTRPRQKGRATAPATSASPQWIVSAVRVVNLTTSYPNGPEPIAALQGISLGIKPGAFTAIVGPPGSGKSTFHGGRRDPGPRRSHRAGACRPDRRHDASSRHRLLERPTTRHPTTSEENYATDALDPTAALLIIDIAARHARQPPRAPSG
jgi:hypothetical protein